MKWKQANWIAGKNKQYLLMIFFISTLVIGGVLLDADRGLKNEVSRKGIISLEFAGSDERAQEIVQRWKLQKQKITTRHGPGNLEISESSGLPAIELAKRSVIYDGFFVISYTTLLILVIILLRSVNAEDKRTSLTRPYWKAHVYMAVAAGALDLIENGLMLLLLYYDLKTAPVFFWFVVAKFTLLAYLLIYILFIKERIFAISNYIKLFLRQVWVNRVSAIGLLIIYLVIWKADQGMDLLLNLNSHPLGVGFFYILITALAILNWYLGRYYQDDYYAREGNVKPLFPQGWKFWRLFHWLKRITRPLFLTGNWQRSKCEPLMISYVPRLLGTLTFLIPAFGILNAFDEMDVPYLFAFISPGLLLAACVLLFTSLMEYEFIERFFYQMKKKGKTWVYHALMLLPIVFIASAGLFAGASPGGLNAVVIGLLMLSISFYMFTSVRTADAFYVHGVLKFGGSNFVTRKAARFILWGGVAFGMMFIVINVYPFLLGFSQEARFLTFSVVLSAVIFYTMFFWFLHCLSKAWSINLSLLVLTVALVMAMVIDNEFHTLHRVTRASSQSLSINDYAREWVEDRRTDIEEYVRNNPGTKYPVFLINSYGGGVRAAAWTSFFIAQMQDTTSGRFHRHVFSYSGASGGTVGASIMLSAASAGKLNDFNPDRVEEFYRNDFLTPVLVGLLGRDVFFSTLGVKGHDRASLQDSIWQESMRAYDNGTYASEFTSLWRDKDPHQSRYDIPVLFSNTFNVELGLKAILSPVKIEPRHFPESIDIDRRLGGAGVKFSTGTFLSARFPFLSPAAKLDSSCHFLDGGIKENSGAETSFELYNTLETIRTASQDSLWNSIEFIFISLDNVGDHEPEHNSKNMFELTAPVSALYNNCFGNAIKAESILEARYTPGRFISINPCIEYVMCEGEEMKPVLPLGWQISDCALLRLRESLRRDCNKEDLAKLLRYFHQGVSPALAGASNDAAAHRLSTVDR